MKEFYDESDILIDINHKHKNDSSTSTYLFIRGLIPISVSILILMYFSFFSLIFIYPVIMRHQPMSLFFLEEYELNWSYLLQCSLFFFEFICLILSFILVIFSKGEEIPDDSMWSLSIPDTHSPQEKIELLALKYIQRKEYLEKNKNYLYQHQFNNNEDSQTIEKSPVTSTTSVVSYDDYSIVNERTSKDEIRYCRTCNKFKPDRTHHCKICNRCFLKMDHHSLWLDKCVSYSNQKYYITFIFYSWNICLFFLIKLFSYFFSLLTNKQFHFPQIAFCILYFFTFILFIVLISNWISCIMFVVNNFTWIEYDAFIRRQNNNDNKTNSYYNIDPFTLEGPKRHKKIASKYYISLWHNWTQFFGYNPLAWFIPIRCELSDNGQQNNKINFKLNDLYAMEIMRNI